MEDLKRQIRLAVIVVCIIVPVGIFGFMLLEDMTLIEAFWLTFTTLTTIGYGDIYAQSDTGRIFTIFLVLVGFGALATALQSSIALFVSPIIRASRQKRLTQRLLDRMSDHFIICGQGEMVDKTIAYLFQGAQNQQEQMHERTYKPIDDFLDQILGDDDHGHYLYIRRPLRRLIMFFIRALRRERTLLDYIVIITTDEKYAEDLRDAGLLVLHGNPTEDKVLLSAGIDRAQAMMVMLDNDTETLMTVLTSRSLAPRLHITAAVLDDELGRKIIRVGANASITPYDTAGTFLNNATLRPAVNDFLFGLFFDMKLSRVVIEIGMKETSPWVGQTIRELQLKERFNASILGIRTDEGRYIYLIEADQVIQEDHVIIVVTDIHKVGIIQHEATGQTHLIQNISLWQQIPVAPKPQMSEKTYSLIEAEEAIQQLENHFIICGTDRVAQRAIAKLNPERPFVIISHNNQQTTELLKRGFRVIHGNPTHEDTLLKAGVKRAQAIMVAIEDKADCILTILTSRAMNKRLLITSAAYSDDMISKLEQAGADRVLSPFHVAARFILLKTLMPEVSEYIDYILFNYQTQLESTELYMEQDSPWIGKSLRTLNLHGRFHASVIGIRRPDGHSFDYAPTLDHVMQAHEVLIVVTPMKHSDTLRAIAHGSETKRPITLRRIQVMKSDVWTRDQIKQMIQDAEQQAPS